MTGAGDADQLAQKKIIDVRIQSEKNQKITWYDLSQDFQN